MYPEQNKMSLKELWNSEIMKIENELEKPIPEFKLNYKNSHSEYDFANQIITDVIYKEFLNTAQPSIHLISNTFKINAMHEKTLQIKGNIIDTLKDIRSLCIRYSKLQDELKDNQIQIDESIIIEQKQEVERRKKEADSKTYISPQEARSDLMTNKDSPFLFRKWLKQIQDSGPDYIKNPTVDDPYPHQTEKLIEDYVGKHVIELLGCSCGNNASYRIHPKYEWNYDSGQWNIKALKGPCSYWSGHIGYCWKGTMSRENLNYA